MNMLMSDLVADTLISAIHRLERMPPLSMRKGKRRQSDIYWPP